VCANCVAIAADRHVDVMEMDAASRTGVDDIRELIEGVRYRPVQARTKIYIIDEVHMLSKNAFNALLKTLEEPPEHVKFIFATTEIRKVPVTVLSRCQRFDLRRVDARILMEHFGRVSEQEGARVEDAALAAIARAADGSVRDGLSILDQAIALADGPVGEAQVREMLGLADRARLFDLIEGLLKGDAAPAIAILEELHRSGADPALVVQDLLDLTHGITRMKIAPSASGEAVMPESERVRGRALADTLSLGALTRAWSLLLKGLQDVQQSPAPHQAAEMVAIRMAYAASLPSPSDAMKVLTEGGVAGPGQITPGSGSPTHGSAPGGSALGGGSLSNGGAGGAGGRVDTNAPPDAPPDAPRAQMMQVVGGTAFEVGGPVGDPAGAHQTQPTATPSPAPQPDDSETAGQPRDFPELVALFEQNREAQLAALLRTAAHLVRFEQERLDLRLAPSVPKDFVGRVSECLRTWTGVRWVVTVSNEAGDPTLQQQAEETKKAEHDAVKEHPAVRAVLEAFPKAEIVAVRKHTALDAQAGGGDEAAWIDPEDLAEDEDALEAALDFDAMHTLEDEEFE
ncbi:MAG: DNA polymerase III subunit gamma/tau, partial [Pseudomonadota bacterium]